MNKAQRRSGRVTLRHESEGKTKPLKTTVEVEDIFAPKLKRWRNSLIGYRNRTNRCTSVRPSFKDFSQLTETDRSADSYDTLLREQFGFQPSTLKELKEMKKSIYPSSNKFENNSHSTQCHRKTYNIEVIEDTSDEHGQWQNVDTTEDLHKFIPNVKDAEVQDEENHQFPPLRPTRIHISETPRVRVIAEKFSKFKRNNIELRRLEEKVVCLEYDVIDLDADTDQPVQKMRAFFSIKPTKVSKENEKGDITTIPSDVKRNYDIEDADIDKLDKREIEIIDGTIAANRSLLEDLKKVLKRKQAIQTKKKQASLDLMYLYEMAKHETPPLDEDYSNTNLLSKGELDEIKELILKKCDSSANGISRRKVRGKRSNLASSQECVISNSLTSELIREAENTIIADLSS